MDGIVAATHLNNPKTVRAWYMYDWANSVYTLVITTAIFPIYYKAIAAESGSDQLTLLGITLQNSVLYSYALSFSFLVVALILPFLSGTADYSGNKKTFMKAFVWMGSLACMGLYFFDGIDMLWWGIACSILASIGYSGSLVFYDAFLPEIVTEDRYDSTSARGYSMGYYGSVILMIVCLIIIMNPFSFGFTGTPKEAGLHATRFTFLLVGLWWIGFSYIPFSILPDNPYGRKPQGNIWFKGYAELRKVWLSLKHQRHLKKYLLAFFFYNMGVQTVMYLATLFGTDVLHLEEDSLIKTVVIIQLVGAFGAWLFARVSYHKGNRFSLVLMNSIWIAVCVGAYFVANEYHFYALAFVVGMIMGGIQSLSRATYSKLIPANTIDHASYFSFYDVTYNLSIVIGTFSYGLVNQLTGSMRNSVLALALFFVIGLVFLLSVKFEKGYRSEVID
ncbi:MAG TPA: MFS transporter [Ohtaekwangia sp.]|nr:MFS transporter [Ohtaekwangia sp.]